MGFSCKLENYEKRLKQYVFSSRLEIKRYAQLAIHIPTDSGLTCTDDLTHLTNARE